MNNDPLADVARQPIVLPREERPIFQIVIDTEEEFDWEGGYDRVATSVRAMRSIHRGQEIFDDFDLRPTYVVDHPVASQEEGYALLLEILTQGRAEIGAHLHPWVSPPFEEELSVHNSFAGNLPADVESAKLEKLTERIEASFGRRPVIYKAGRYGFGPNTPRILEDLGFEVDLSFCPAFDFSSEGGPDYSALASDPYWFGGHRRLLGLPATGAFVGLLRRGASRLHRWIRRPGLERAHLPGILSRSRLFDRLHLSPEGFSFGELRRLTEHLLRRGTRIFTLSFHSPSLEPGCTPYVRSEADLGVFLDTIQRYMDYFLGKLGGRSMTPLEIKRHLESRFGGAHS